MREEAYDFPIYIRCMEEVKWRIGVLDDAVLSYRQNENPKISDFELAALQLRMCYEIIGFSLISANKKLYSALRIQYEKDWNFCEILKSIERINKNFLPISIKKDSTENNEENLKKQQLSEYHGKLGNILHASNPYANEVDFLKWFDWIIERRDEIVKWLSKHMITPGDNRAVAMVYMSFGPSGEVAYMVLSADVTNP